MTTAPPLPNDPDENEDQNEKAEASPQPEISVSIEEITPELAAELLGTNIKNRKIRPSMVEAYARAMERGEWQLTGESVKIDPDGHMIDGQHRCMGVVRAGVPVKMVVARNVSPDAQAVMDSGVKRQAHDYFAMNGMHNSAVIAAIARFSVRLQSYAKTITNSEVVSWVEENPEVQLVAEVASMYRNSIDIHPSVVGVAWMHLFAVDQERCEEFFESIATNKTEGKGDPRHALIRRLVTARRTSERLSQEAQLALLFRTWNAWITGERMLKIPVGQRHGRVHIPKPVPYGTLPRHDRYTRDGTRGRRSVAKDVEVTPEDYENFDWPTAPDGAGPTESPESPDGEAKGAGEAQQADASIPA